MSSKSSSTALRLALAVLLCAGLTAASNIATCPMSSSTDFYAAYNGAAPCAVYNTCVATYCSCIGGTGVDNATGYCTFGQTRPSCSLNQNCLTALMPCLNKQATDASCNATSLSSLRIALANLAGGAFYNGSTTENACYLHTCKLTNNSVLSANTCNLTAAANAACIPPFTYTGVLTISGDWSAILANLTAKEIARLSIQVDLTKQLGVRCTVLDLMAGSLIVVFQADVSGSNSALLQNIADAASGSAWLASTQSVYTNNGGQGSLTVQSISAQTTAPPTTTGVVPTPTVTGPPTSPPGGGQVQLSAVVASLIATVAALLVMF